MRQERLAFFWGGCHLENTFEKESDHSGLLAPLYFVNYLKGECCTLFKFITMNEKSQKAKMIRNRSSFVL